ncbi:MAG: hypothetical protein OIF47_06905 [Marinibacterium sp.]|nr:hypothetical protein [Marinibacterium sp.]
MTHRPDHPSLFAAIWHSLKALPTWVILWMMFWLGPINMASIAFLNEPKGALIALLAWGGMAASLITVIMHRGFSRLVAGGHVFFWTPLVLIVLFARPEGSAAYSTYLTVLLATNVFSLIFDINDLRRWLGGDHSVLGHDQTP